MTEIKLGPSGGTGGSFAEAYLTENATLHKIEVHAGSGVDSITLLGKLPEQRARFGEALGGEASTIVFEDGDALVRIKGRYGSKIDSITLDVIDHDGVLKTYGPYGGTGGDRDFIYDIPVGYRLSGFFGSTGKIIDALGVALYQVEKTLR